MVRARPGGIEETVLRKCAGDGGERVGASAGARAVGGTGLVDATPAPVGVTSAERGRFASVVQPDNRRTKIMGPIRRRIMGGRNRSAPTAVVRLRAGGSRRELHRGPK